MFNFLTKRIQDFGIQPVYFGLFGIINYPLSYIYYTYFQHGTKEVLILRILCTTICLFLIFLDKFKIHTRHIQYLIWFAAVTFCIPFFASYMLLLNASSEAWLLNCSLGLFLLVLLFDWATFLLSLFIGTSLGFLFFTSYHSFSNLEINLPYDKLLTIIYTYMFACILGVIFARNNEIDKNIKTKSFNLITKMIVHELRTPLSAININCDGLLSSLPKEDNNKIISILSQIKFLSCTGLFTLDFLVSDSNNSTHKNIKFSYFNIKDSIENLIYSPIFSQKDKAIIQLDLYPFTLNINEYYFFNICSNIIQNSLNSINKKGSGNITIRSNENYEIIFRDTGKGISKKSIHKIFDLYFTTSKHGTGLGLYFCKNAMESMGGSISCKSVEGEYTEFVLKFPKVEEAI
jgi:signal transduction histidine kinase